MAFVAEIVRMEVLTPQQFIALMENDPGAVKSATVRPPALGERGYGSITVEYAVPRLRNRR
jgi:hypothetical protein